MYSDIISDINSDTHLYCVIAIYGAHTGTANSKMSLLLGQPVNVSNNDVMLS